MASYSRREFAALGLGVLAPAAEQRSYAEDYPHMLVSYVSKLVNRHFDHWESERAKLKTAAQIEARNRFVREKAIELMHGFPERNPLNPVTVNTFDREGYRIETMLFQSRPNFWVPSTLYVPTTGSGPFPGIVVPCGHSANGRLYRSYQLLCLNLVRCGFVVLTWDPIGQGERRQHWNPRTKRMEWPGPVTEEHMLSGQLLLLIGEDLTNYRIWDGMRAIDYLLARPDVDPKRIGCTGQSGGGTFTLFLSALDERIRCAAIHEGGTAHRWPARFRPESVLDTGDTEQHIFRAGLHGIDLCDLHVAIAPRPLLATIEHYSERFNSTAEHIRERYRQLGVPGKFATEQATDPHGMTVKLRLAATDWFCRWFLDRRGPAQEADLRIEPDEVLYCAPNGSLRHSQIGETIFSLILKKQAKLPPEKGAASREKIEFVIRYRRTEGPAGARQLLVTPRRGYRIEKLEFLSEAGIYIPAWVFVPEKSRASQTAIVFVNENGVARDGMEFGPLEGLARRGHLVVGLDVRGIGGTAPSQPGDAETTLQYLLWEVDESLLGMRVQDVVRGVDYALSRSDVDRSGVRLIGKGRGALWALYAAALDSRIQSTVCEGGLLSYGTLASSDKYTYEADVFALDVLKHFDLPQVAAVVAPRRLTLLSPAGPLREPVSLEAARRVYRPAVDVRIAAADGGAEAAEQYLRLL